MKLSRFVINLLCLLGLWLGFGLQAHAQTDTVTYVYTDPQGTPLVEADAQGNVIARYDYTSYGNVVASLGNPPDGPGYTGHVNDCYFGEQRDMQSATGVIDDQGFVDQSVQGEPDRCGTGAELYGERGRIDPLPGCVPP